MVLLPLQHMTTCRGFGGVPGGHEIEFPDPGVAAYAFTFG
jgi:hypothetical protein